MIIKDLPKHLPLLTPYTELRSQVNQSLNIVYTKGNLTQNIKNSVGGISARVYRNGSWGFASSPNRTDVQNVLKAAADNAIFLDTRENKGLAPFTPSNPKAEYNFGTSKPRLSQREIMAFTKEVDEHIQQKYPDLSSRTIRLNSLTIEKTLITSDGASLYSLWPRTMFSIFLSITKDGDTVDIYNSMGNRGHFEDLFTSPQDLYPFIEELYEHLKNKSEGVYAKAGTHDCILDADLAGILAHEAIGHTTEADLVLGGSVAADYLNKEAAAPLVTLIDFAHSYNGETCPMPIHIDDEGTEAQDAIIIDKGILKGYMHNKQSANHFGVEPTGNGRAYEYHDEPLIRMRNTAILPGESKLADMIASIDEGYYLAKPTNGQADTTSEFMFGIALGYEIKNGKLGKAIKDTTVSGIAFEVLQNISMVGDEMVWTVDGMCGKKQAIPVGMGGPAVKTKISIGGR